MPWAKEEAFRTLLLKIANSATTNRLVRAAELAVADEVESAAYVTAIVVKEIKQLKPQYKLRVFYALSSIARMSVAKNGSRSKYAERWGNQLDMIGDLMKGIPFRDKALVGRVLDLWWRDGVFPASAISRLQARFPSSAPNAPRPAVAAPNRHAPQLWPISKTPPDNLDTWDVGDADIVTMAKPSNTALPESPPSGANLTQLPLVRDDIIDARSSRSHLPLHTAGKERGPIPIVPRPIHVIAGDLTAKPAENAACSQVLHCPPTAQVDDSLCRWRTPSDHGNTF